MRMTVRVRRILASVAAAVFVIAGAATGTAAASAATPALPAASVVRMAALGDSISQALMTCSSLVGCPVNSWSTGSSTAVNSHLLRLRAAGATSIVGYNDAVSTAKSALLNSQAQKAVSTAQAAQYVTIEIGANDACTRTVSAMTPTATFKANVQAALATLTASSSAPQIFIASIPSLQRLYEVNKSNISARLTWGLLGLCQSMLVNPTSTKAADVQRRAAVQTRVNEYNAALVQLCAPIVTCRYDGGVVAGYQFVRSDISTRDYFHPSISGQATLAAKTWPMTQWVAQP
ncbi:GDSL-type esterase/lipase family protein [Microbacterium pumilum]|uniref:SGNH/GDSL hydrolase family protein n=1 Tax=Microbacterium pumilum TaxID=344165 RepID=A0ABP5EFW9_9MICO